MKNKTNPLTTFLSATIIIDILLVGIYVALAVKFGMNGFSLLFLMFAGFLIGPGISMIITRRTTMPRASEFKTKSDFVSLGITTLLSGFTTAAITSSNSGKSRLVKVMDAHSNIPGGLSVFLGSICLLLAIANFMIPIPTIVNQFMDIIFGDN